MLAQTPLSWAKPAARFLRGMHPDPRRHTGPPGAAQPFSIHPCPALPQPLWWIPARSQCFDPYRGGSAPLTLPRSLLLPQTVCPHMGYPTGLPRTATARHPQHHPPIHPCPLPAQRQTQPLLMSVQFLGRDGMFWDSPSSWEKARLGSSSLLSVGLCLQKYCDRDLFSERLCAGIVHSLGK